jgi:hypothetical protein
VLLVLLDGNLEVTSIHELDRKAIEDKFSNTESKSLRDRHAPSVSWFKSHGRLRWPAAGGRTTSNFIGGLSRSH